MTISNQTTKHVYDGNGTATQWPYTFQLLEDDTTCIHVYLVSPAGVITETVQFTVDTDNLKVVYPSVASELPPLATGWKIVLLRLEPITQALDLINQGTFNAEAIEAELDKLTMICQQLGEALGRTVQYTLADDITNPTTAKFLSDCQAAQDAAEASASEASSSKTSAFEAASISASAALDSASFANSASNSATSASNSAIAAAASAASVDVHLNGNQTFTGFNKFSQPVQIGEGVPYRGSTLLYHARLFFNDTYGLMIELITNELELRGGIHIAPWDGSNYARVGINTLGSSGVATYPLDVASYHNLEDAIIAARTLNKSAGFLIVKDWEEASKWYYDGTNTYFDYSGPLKFRAGVGGTEKASIDASGNVAASGNLTISGTGDSSVAGKLGIGTTSPSQKLEVAGIVKSSGSSNSLMFADRTTSANTFEWYSSNDIASLYSTVSAANVLSVNTDGALTLKDGIVGKTDGSSASAGKVGEVVSSRVMGVTVSPNTCHSYGNVTSISLTAGDWIIAGTVGTADYGSMVSIVAFISRYSGNDATDLSEPENFLLNSASSSRGNSSLPAVHLSLSSTTTVYLKIRVDYSGAAGTAYGFIMARRIR